MGTFDLQLFFYRESNNIGNQIYLPSDYTGIFVLFCELPTDFTPYLYVDETSYFFSTYVCLCEPMQRDVFFR